MLTRAMGILLRARTDLHVARLHSRRPARWSVATPPQGAPEEASGPAPQGREQGRARRPTHPPALCSMTGDPWLLLFMLALFSWAGRDIWRNR